MDLRVNEWFTLEMQRNIFSAETRGKKKFEVDVKELYGGAEVSKETYVKLPVS